jgi:hypothetical protein
MLPILKEGVKRMFYGFGFGMGMGFSFKLLPITRISTDSEKFN